MKLSNITKQVSFLMLLFLMPAALHGANHDINGIIYNLNTTNMRASVQGPGSSKALPSKLVIPDKVTYKNKTYTVTSVANEAFHGETAITSLQLGSNIETIGTLAFCDTKVKNVTWPKKLRIIGRSAFWGTEIVNLNLPSSVEIIRGSAFGLCSNLQTVTFNGSNLTEIGEGAFYSCKSLTSVSIPPSVTTMGKETFYDCLSLKAVTLSPKVTVIPVSAFENCPIANLIIPSTVTAISEAAFCKCATPWLTIPPSVKSIGDWAFALSTSENITLNEGLQSIGEGAFSQSHKLQYIVIPSSVKTIGKEAFAYSAVKTAIIPSTLTNIPERMFYENPITGLNFPEGVQSIGKEAFANNRLLEYVTFTASVKDIGYRAFWDCDKLEAINLHNGLQKIGQEAFSGCSAVKKIDIPVSVTLIDTQAFLGCWHLMDITVANPVPCTLLKDGFSSSTYENCRLIVPDGTVNTYRAANEWSRFKYIRQITGIDDIIADDDTEIESVTYYDHLGRTVADPVPGRAYIAVTTYSSGRRTSTHVRL